MKRYQVEMTQKAIDDMEMIYDYIAEKLHAPSTAMRQYNRIADEIESLSSFPERNMLFDTSSERELGMRRLIIGNYSAVYVVRDDTV